MVLDNQFQLQSKLSGFGGRFRPTESFWSIASKVCWANSLTASSLGPFMRGGYGSGLLTGSKLQAFAGATGIDLETIKVGMGYRLLDAPDHEIRELAYPELRYCPTCMSESGFHSILFQFPLFQRCPAHPDMKLVTGCQHCKASIPYAPPSSAVKVFGCGRCEHRLWKPIQRPFVLDPRDQVFEDLADWAANWMGGVLKFSGSAAPLRHWVDANLDDLWAKQGFPELDGVFTVRALRGAVEAGYWGGRQRVTESSVQDSIEVYLEVAEAVASYVDLPFEKFGAWIHEWHSSRDASVGRRRWAFAAWRVFWEALGQMAELTGDGYSQKGADITAVFRDQFRRSVAPAGFGSEAAAINSLILREVLRATFVQMLVHVETSAELPAFQDLSGVVQSAPAPVFLIKPTESGALVEWIHQAELSKGGLVVFR